MPLPEDEAEWKNLTVVFATAKGNIRKNSLEDFSNINNSGKIAMKLDQDDKIIGVKICKDDQDILLSTQFGKCIRFKSKKLRLFKGRSSKGINGIKLNEKDKVIESHGVNVYVDPKSFLYLIGTEIDFVDELNQSGFKFVNPNAKRTCGCGESFSI